MAPTSFLDLLDSGFLRRDDEGWVGNPVSVDPPRKDVPATDPPAGAVAAEPAFWPEPPRSAADCGVGAATLRGIVLKYFAHAGEASGFDAARQARLPFGVVEPLLRELRDEKLIGYNRSSGGGHDFEYQLTEQGRVAARHYAEGSTYFGAAPVAFADYERSVRAQSPRGRRLDRAKIAAAFADLTLDPAIVRRVGQALAGGRTLLLFGAPGNGKTSLAERLVRPFGDCVWIPRALDVDGEVVRLFDPAVHREAPDAGGRPHDERWVRVERPLVVVGGELTLEALELRFHAASRTYEAPVHLKSNGGVLLIDDFGRQRVGVTELLNRWIVPLERKVDYLDLANGKRVCVPFEQMLVFSTNLDPGDVADEAFLRRIPYKVAVPNPTEGQFRAVFASTAAALGLALDPREVDRLLATHYRPSGRPLRFCHPRDLLRQVADRCGYLGEPPVVTSEALDEAAANYFAKA